MLFLTSFKKVSSKNGSNIAVRVNLLLELRPSGVNCWSIESTFFMMHLCQKLSRCQVSDRDAPKCGILSGALTAAKVDSCRPLPLDRRCLRALQKTSSKTTVIFSSLLSSSHTRARATTVVRRFWIGGGWYSVK